MTYAKGQQITTTDINSLMDEVGGVYGVGRGDVGYGQTAIPLVHAISTSVAQASTELSIRNAIVACASHQGTSTTLLPPASEFDLADIIRAYRNGAPTNSPYDLPQMITNITTNRFNTNNRASLTQALALSETTNQAWGSGNTFISTEIDITFGSEDEARYFFNSGGEVVVYLNHPNTSTAQNTYWNTTLTAVGRLCLRANSSTTTGTAGVFASGIGFYQLTAANQQWLAVNNYGGGVYGANDVNVYVRALNIHGVRGGNGNVVRVRVELRDEYMRTLATDADFVNAGTAVSVDIVRATGVLTITPPTVTTSSSWTETVIVTNPDDMTPDPFVFQGVTNAPLGTVYTATATISGINLGILASATGGQISINGGPWVTSGYIYNNQQITVRGTSSTQFSVDVSIPVVVGTYTTNFVISTMAADTTPDSFMFIPVASAALTTQYNSNTVTITGINTVTPVSVTNGYVSINGGSWTTVGYVYNGQTIQVLATSAASPDATVTAVVTVGTFAANYVITTFAADTTPDPFSFTDVYGATPSQPYNSTVTITGINAGSPVSVTGGTVSINGGSETTSGIVYNGQTIRVTAFASSSTSTTTDTTVTVGSTSDTFSITTYAADVTPNGFSFNDLSGVTPSTVFNSNTVTITGINVATPVTVTNGLFSINGGSFVSSGSVYNNQTLTLRATSSPTGGATVSQTVTVGTVSATWNITTMLDLIPDDFSFTPALVYPNVLVTSNTVTISGVSAGATIPFTVSGPGNPSVSVNGGAFVTSGTFSNGSTLQAQATSTSVYGSSSVVSISYNGTSHQVWTITTRHEIPAATMYSTAGSYTYTVPQYVTQIKLEGEGGGGAGGNGAVGSGYARNTGSGSIGTLICGGGGGGGAGTYASTILNVTPGDQVSIVVGTAGIHNSSPYSTNSLTNTGSQTLYYGAGSNGGVTYAVYSGAVQLYCLGGSGGSGGTADVTLTPVGGSTYIWLGSSGSGGAGGSIGGASGGSTTSSYAYGGAGGNGGSSRLGVGGVGGKGGVNGGSGSQSGESGKVGTGPAAGGGGGGGDGINSYGLGADGTAGWARVTPTLTV